MSPSQVKRQTKGTVFIILKNRSSLACAVNWKSEEDWESATGCKERMCTQWGSRQSQAVCQRLFCQTGSGLFFVLSHRGQIRTGVQILNIFVNTYMFIKNKCCLCTCYLVWCLVTWNCLWNKYAANVPTASTKQSLSKLCGGSYIVILNIFISYMCLANYGASEAIYLCNLVEKIHQYFRPKMRQMF